jgi:hypothetical protein
MRPRIDHLGRRAHDRHVVLEGKSNPLASAPAQGRRRAVRAQSLAILHKVGCSWSARPAGVLRTGSAGPTTRPRFEPIRSTPAGRQTGEPTVSHEGCSGFDFSSVYYQGAFPPPLSRRSRSIHPAARRVARRVGRCGLFALVSRGARRSPSRRALAGHTLRPFLYASSSFCVLSRSWLVSSSSLVRIRTWFASRSRSRASVSSISWYLTCTTASSVTLR